MVVPQVDDVPQAAVQQLLLFCGADQVQRGGAEETAVPDAPSVGRRVAADVPQVRDVVEPDEAGAVVFGDMAVRVWGHENSSWRTRLRFMKSWFRPTPMPAPSGIVCRPSSAFSMRSVMSSSQ